MVNKHHLKTLASVCVSYSHGYYKKATKVPKVLVPLCLTKTSQQMREQWFQFFPQVRHVCRLKKYWKCLNGNMALWKCGRQCQKKASQLSSTLFIKKCAFHITAITLTFSNINMWNLSQSQCVCGPLRWSMYLKHVYCFQSNLWKFRCTSRTAFSWIRTFFRWMTKINIQKIYRFLHFETSIIRNCKRTWYLHSSLKNDQNYTASKWRDEKINAYTR